MEIHVKLILNCVIVYKKLYSYTLSVIPEVIIKLGFTLQYVHLWQH